MSHTWLAVGALAVGTGAIAAQQPTFRSRTDTVTVNVSVMNGRQPVTGLTSSDFALTDNNAPQLLDAVSLEHVPIDLTLVITGYPVDRSAEHRQANISAEATRQLLRPVDRLRLVIVNHEVAGALVPSDTRLADEAPGYWIPGIALTDGLFYALAWPVDADRRHLVVAFTDGDDNWSTLETEMLPKLASHSDAVVHAVFWASPDKAGSRGATIYGPPTAPIASWESSYRLVGAAVKQTGGTIQRTKQAPQALSSIIADFRSSYVLRYTPTELSPGWHELRVRLTKPGSFTIRARQGYELR